MKSLKMNKVSTAMGEIARKKNDQKTPVSDRNDQVKLVLPYLRCIH